MVMYNVFRFFSAIFSREQLSLIEIHRFDIARTFRFDMIRIRFQRLKIWDQKRDSIGIP